MIATRQKKHIVNKVVNRMLVSGIYPTLSEILSGVNKYIKGKVWGKPMAEFRPAINDMPIGGQTGTDIEDTFEEIREDLVVFNEELLNTAENTIDYYNVFSSRKEFLKRRLLRLIQSSDATVRMFATGNAILFQDTFNSDDHIDTGKTTAALDLEGGFATLPASTSTVAPISLNGATVRNESYPTAKPHSSLTQALNDSGNQGWYANLDGKTYRAIIDVSSGNALSVNGVYIDPLAPMHIKVMYTNDGSNFYDLIDERVIQEKTWEFGTIAVKAIQIEVTGEAVGIKRLKLLNLSHVNAAVLQSSDYTAKDVFDNKIGIETVRLEVDDDCPPGTSIDYYVSSLHTTSTGSEVRSTWTKMGSDTVWISSRQETNVPIDNAYSASDPEDPRQFYIAKLAADPILESSRLTKGRGQFIVEYVQHDWSADVDPNHTPSLDDWDRFDPTIKGYFSPITYAPDSTTLTRSITGYSNGYLVTLAEGEDPLQFGTNVLSKYESMLGEANRVLVDTNTYERSGWMVFGLAGSGVTENDKWILSRAGNYKFTTYVYMPEDVILTDRPCLLLNPSYNYGSGNPTIAPFKVYLNGDVVADVSTAHSGVLEQNINDYSCSYAFKRGWNKLDILVYVIGTLDSGADMVTGASTPSGDIATHGIGIYISPNIFQMQRNNRAIQIQAHAGSDKQVSEFAMRQLVKPGDTSCWAWTDTAPYRDVLLNYDPSVYSDTFDGINKTNPPRLELYYRSKGSDAPSALTFRAELKKEPNSSRIPKLHGYKLFVNPTSV